MTIRAPLILKTDAGGRPIRWIDYQAAAGYLLRDEVAWASSEIVLVLRGGISQLTGERSRLAVPSILGIRSARATYYEDVVPALTNANLFRRDRYVCAYCGEDFSARGALLTRDHVTPVSRGGENVWSNVVTACRACNEKKANRLVGECGMQPLYVPYAPSLAEGMILRNRRIMADQMAYLVHQLPKGQRARYAL